MLLARHFLTNQSVLRRPDAPTGPRTSVVLPIPAGYPVERLRSALAALLTPTASDVELLVVEDGADAVQDRELAAVQERDPRLVRVRHSRAFGLMALLANAGIEQSRGAFIRVLDPADPRHEGSGLFPRARFEEVGLADPHLALTEVWLDDLRERLTAAGRYDDHCLPRRLLRDVARADRLGLTTWRDAPVDDLSRCGIELNAATRRALYERFVRPFYLRYRHRLHLERFPLNLQDEPRDVAILRYGRDGGDHISFYNFDAQMRERGTYRFHAHPPKPDYETPIRADLLVTFRSFITPHGDQIVQKVVQAGLPMACYLDDDLINLHEIPQFAYMKPGKPAYNSMIRQAEVADVVWVTNDYLASVYRPVNPRLVPHMGCIRPELLPAKPFTRKPNEPITIAYCGAAYRVEEFRGIWESLRRVAREYRGRVKFAFWGLNPADLPPLDAPTTYEPFSVGYEEYLTRLARARFDVFLTPLFEHPRCRLGKSLIKYYELALSGAIGVFSDVYQYNSLPAGETLLKARNDPESWFETLREAVTMSDAERDGMRRRCLEHVRETYTSSAQVHLVEAGCRATELHGATRQARHLDGRPRLLLTTVAGSVGRAAWLRRRELLPRYGIEPVTIELGTSASPENLVALINQFGPFLVESLGYHENLAEACRRLGLPYLPTAREVPDDVPLALTSVAEPSSGPTRSFCYRGLGSAEAFEIGTRRLRFEKDTTFAQSLDAVPRPLRVVGLGDERALRAALEQTPRAAGWHLDCVVEDTDPVGLLREADLLLIEQPPPELSGWLLDAMAAGVLVVTRPGPGVAELILDNETGVLAREPLVEGLRRALAMPGALRQEALFAARRVAQEEFHCERAASELMLAYGLMCCTKSRRNFVRLHHHNGGRGTISYGAPTLPPESDSIVRVERFNTVLRYELAPGGLNWAGISLTVYAEELTDPVPIHLDLFDARGKLVRTASAEVQPGVSYQMVTFRYPPIAIPDPKPYLVVLRPTRVPAPGVLRIFEIVPGRRTLVQRAWRKYLRSFKRKGLACRLVHARAT